MSDWKWNVNDRDPAIDISFDGIQAKRTEGGHNPSVRGDKGCSNKNRQYYFEVQAIHVGEWLSFGFSSKNFGVSCESHAGAA